MKVLHLGLARSTTGTVVTATAAVAPASAAHAVLAPVAGSCKYDAGLWDEALRRHFAVPRVLRCGDLCGVLVASDSHGRAAPPPDDAACVQRHSAATTCTEAGGTSAVAALYEAATTRYTVAVFRVEKLRLSPDTPGDASCERWATVHAASTAVVQAAPVHTLCPRQLRVLDVELGRPKRRGQVGDGNACGERGVHTRRCGDGGSTRHTHVDVAKAKTQKALWQSTRRHRLAPFPEQRLRVQEEHREPGMGTAVARTTSHRRHTRLPTRAKRTCAELAARASGTACARFVAQCQTSTCPPHSWSSRRW